MELRSELLEETRARRRRVDGPVVVGAEGAIRAGRANRGGAIQRPPHIGHPARGGADAGRTAVHPVDHATGGGRRIGAAVILPDGEDGAPFRRMDGVAGAIGDDDHHRAVAGDQIVIAPAKAGGVQYFAGQSHLCKALDVGILGGNRAGAIGPGEELAGACLSFSWGVTMGIRKAVGA